MKINNFKCPNCGAELHINSKRNTVICEYCGSSISVESLSYNFENSNEKDNRINVLLLAIDRELNKRQDCDNKVLEKYFDELFTIDLYNVNVIYKYYHCGYKRQAVIMLNNCYITKGNDEKTKKEIIKCVISWINASKDSSYLMNLMKKLNANLKIEPAIHIAYEEKYKALKKKESEPVIMGVIIFVIMLAILILILFIH